MGCCYCKYLDENDKKEGKCTGALYYCKKKKKYVSGSSDGCDSFSKDYARKSYIISEIFTDGKNFYNDSTDVGVYVVILIVMILLGTIVNLFS